jgi:hypothetical protein
MSLLAFLFNILKVLPLNCVSYIVRQGSSGLLVSCLNLQANQITQLA